MTEEQKSEAPRAQIAEATVDRIVTRSRIAEGVAVVTTVAVALAAVAHEVAQIVHDLTARSCP